MVVTAWPATFSTTRSWIRRLPRLSGSGRPGSDGRRTSNSAPPRSVVVIAGAGCRRRDSAAGYLTGGDLAHHEADQPEHGGADEGVEPAEHPDDTEDQPREQTGGAGRHHKPFRYETDGGSRRGQMVGRQASGSSGGQPPCGRAGGPGSVTASPGIWTSSTRMLIDRPLTSGATAARTWALRSPTGTPNRATTPISIRSASTLTPVTCRPARKVPNWPNRPAVSAATAGHCWTDAATTVANPTRSSGPANCKDRLLLTGPGPAARDLPARHLAGGCRSPPSSPR